MTSLFNIQADSEWLNLFVRTYSVLGNDQRQRDSAGQVSPATSTHVHRTTTPAAGPEPDKIDVTIITVEATAAIVPSVAIASQGGTVPGLLLFLVAAGEIAYCPPPSSPPRFTL